MNKRTEEATMRNQIKPKKHKRGVK